MSFIEKVDIFGIAISFRFNHFKSHKTYFGGMMTITILSVIIFQAVKITKGVLDQDSPTVIQEQRYVYQPEIFNILPKTFNIAIGLQDGLSRHFKDESIYYIRGTQQVINRVLNSTTGEYDSVSHYRSVTIEDCTEDHFQIPSTKEYFKKLTLDLLYCLALNETNLAIEGEFSALRYQALQLEVVICQNTTDSKNCSSQEIIDSKILTPRLGVYLSDTYINVTNRDTPYYYAGRNLFWPSSSQLSKEARLYLKNNYITSDVGYIFAQEKNDRIVSYSSNRELMTIRSDQVLYSFVIGYEKNTETKYNRTYPKFDTAFAEIGGFFNALISIGCLFCWPISQLELNRKLINQSYRLTLTRPLFKKKRFIENNNSLQNNQIIRLLSENNINNKETNLRKPPDYLQDDKQIPPGNIDQINTTYGRERQKTKNLNTNELDNQMRVVKQYKSSLSNIQLVSKQSDLAVTNMNLNQQENIQNDSERLEQAHQQQPRTFVSFNQNITKDQRSQTKISSLSQSQIPHTESQGSQLKIKSKRLTWVQIIMNIFRGRSSVKKQSSQENARKHNSESDITISFVDYLFNFFGCCESRKSRLIRQGTDHLYNQIDIFYIINKLSQIDKLKYILLNNYQIKLFDILPKPVVQEREKIPRESSENIPFYRRRSSQIPKTNRASTHAKSPYFSSENHKNNSNHSFSSNRQQQIADQEYEDIQESLNILTSNIQSLSPVDSRILQMLRYPLSLSMNSQFKNDPLLNDKDTPISHRQLELETPLEEGEEEENVESILDSQLKSMGNADKNVNKISSFIYTHSNHQKFEIPKLPKKNQLCQLKSSAIIPQSQGDTNINQNNNNQAIILEDDLPNQGSILNLSSYHNKNNMVMINNSDFQTISLDTKGNNNMKKNKDVFQADIVKSTQFESANNKQLDEDHDCSFIFNSELIQEYEDKNSPQNMGKKDNEIDNCNRDDNMLSSHSLPSHSNKNIKESVQF